MARMDIKGEQRSIQKVFCDDFVLRVPHYQRPYAWKLENAQDLLADLLSFMGDGSTRVDDLPPYFLGSIVLVKDDAKFDADVIDGQQRLTTLTILLATLRASTGDDFGKDLTKYLYQPGSLVEGTPDQYRLRLRDRDAEFFREFVQAEDGPAKLKALTRELPDAQRRIRENALLFQRELEALSIDRRQHLASYLVRRCFLVVVSTQDTDSAYRIFSVLNDRGLDLSHADILKAEIIGKIDDEALQKDYARKWEEVEEEIGRDAFKDLFGHLRMIYRRAKLGETVLAEFRKYVVEEWSEPKKLVDDVIVAGAWAYDQIRRCNWDGDTDDRTRAKIEELLEWLKRLDNEDWVPAAIRIMQSNADAARVLKHLEALERLAAFLLITRSNVNERIRRYASVLGAIKDGVAIAAGGPLLLTDDEEKALVVALDGKIYLEPKVRVYVLLRLDRALGDRGAKYDIDTITVEHVLPQNPRDNSEWLINFPTPEDRACTHRLGNLLLLSRRKNSEASNWDFGEKKKRYFSSKRGVSTFALTSQVLNEVSWTPEVVARRQTKAIDTLKKVWSLK
ncbi:MAG: DUF262 domain-containing HNH endonuclease family protein [Polyangiaceae bacterium]|nr:DUF262 domain-containing HNH endonuclease family protein [Polyangiaceae bacterium]